MCVCECLGVCLIVSVIACACVGSMFIEHGEEMHHIKERGERHERVSPTEIETLLAELYLSEISSYALSIIMKHTPVPRRNFKTYPLFCFREKSRRREVNIFSLLPLSLSLL